jgi:hypothetical protein
MKIPRLAGPPAAVLIGTYDEISEFMASVPPMDYKEMIFVIPEDRGGQIFFPPKNVFTKGLTIVDSVDKIPRAWKERQSGQAGIIDFNTFSDPYEIE